MGKILLNGIEYSSGGSSSHIYSTTEQQVGKGTDGKPIYEISVDTGALPNNTTKTVAHGVSNMKFAKVIIGSARNTNTGIRIPLPYVYKSGSTAKCLQVYVDDTNITLVSMENMSGYTESEVTIQYNKTTD